jgi:hypothetical protein
MVPLVEPRHGIGGNGWGRQPPLFAAHVLLPHAGANDGCIN